MRAWSWLRQNAFIRFNTCKSIEELNKCDNLLWILQRRPGEQCYEMLRKTLAINCQLYPIEKGNPLNNLERDVLDELMQGLGSWNGESISKPTIHSLLWKRERSQWNWNKVLTPSAAAVKNLWLWAQAWSSRIIDELHNLVFRLRERRVRESFVLLS